MRLYWEIGRRAFQRQLAYRTANMAGMATNAFFGYVRAAIFIAGYAHAEQIAGYDVASAVTYVWVTQAVIMVVVLWAWWDVERTIKSGDVVSDLSKPFSYLGFWLARDLGRAAYFLVFRCVPIVLVGQLVHGLRWPSGPLPWLAALFSLLLAITISFAWRFMVNLSAFWLTDARGIGGLVNTLVLFLSGFVVPIRFFPEWAQAGVLALPFAGIIQVPVDAFLERITGAALVAALVNQALWAVALLAASQAIVALATRRVVVQGG